MKAIIRRPEAPWEYCGLALLLGFLVLGGATRGKLQDRGARTASRRPDAEMKASGQEILATVSLKSGEPGRLIPPDFDGFSIEVDDTARKYLGPGSAPNLVFYQLLKNLGTGTIRIGGDSADYSCWDPGRALHPDACHFTITPDDVAGYFKASAATGWPLIPGINLAQNDAHWALEYGRKLASTSRAVSGARLLGFEFGNEPDLFPTETHARPKGYSWKELVRDWNAYVQAFKSDPITDGIPLAGPAYDDADSAWKDSFLKPFVDGVGAKNLGIVTVHEYPTDTCNGDHVTIGQLVSERLMQSYVTRAAGWVRTAGSERLPLELGETNSAACAGAHGVDDTFASTVWGLDWLFANARLGFRRINFHMDDAAYSAVFATRTRTRAGLTAYSNRVSALYYAMFLFRNAVNKRLLPATTRSASNVKAYAVSSCPTCAVAVFVINKDPSASGIVEVIPSKPMGAASLLVVQAASLSSKSVTYGGRSFDNSTGLIAPPENTEVVPASNGHYRFKLPNASAVMLTISPS